MKVNKFFAVKKDRDPNMRIMWVSYSRILELDVHLSGVEKLQRLQYLARSGHEVFMITGDFKKKYDPKSPNLHIIRIPLRYVPKLSPLLYGFSLFFFLPFYLVKIRPDFVITDPSTACFAIWKPILSKVLDFKMILDIRSTIVDPQFSKKASFDMSVYVAKTMFDGMTIVTPMMRDEICQKFHIAADWVGIVSNGVSDELLNYNQTGIERRVLREKFGLSGKFVVLYHGAFRANGGLIESVEAMGSIKKHRSDIVLFLLGRGDPTFISLLKRKIKESNVEDIVVLHESVPFNKVPKYISMSDVGLVPLPNSPSWRNQQPNKLLEYMAMKKPAIVSESPGHRFVLGNGKAAIFVSHIVSSELAAAMEYACDNQDKLNQYGKTVRDIAFKKFAWKKVNEDLMTYMLNVRLSKNGGPRVAGENSNVAYVPKRARARNSAKYNQLPLMTTSRRAWLGAISRNEKQSMHFKRRRKLQNLEIVSQFCHLITLSLKRPRTQLACGSIITSIDVDVGSSRLGEINKGENDANIHGYLSESYVGEVEEKTTPKLIQFFDSLAIPVTFAIRGQLVAVENSILELVLNSSTEHEIGAHGYYHRRFTSLSRAEAENELEMISTGFQKVGVKPRSFVFPENCVSHLDLLERFGYMSYRDEGSLRKDGLFIRKKGQLYDVHPGYHLGHTYNPIFLFKIIDIAATYKLPFHLWFHPRDIFEARGSTQRSIERVLSPIYNYAKKKEEEGTLKFETMQSIVNKIKTYA